MSRLSLDQFKKETVKKGKDVKELEKLTGGILGACHTVELTGPEKVAQRIKEALHL